jgi:hypothetical protein
LDVAVLRAEKSGHARLGAALARAASPKLALSRQFDAWGSLLGVGWAAAKSAGDKEGEAFFLSEARTRRKAIGRAALTTALALEAGVLWRELAALHAHSAAHQVANAGAAVPSPVTSLPVHTVTTSHVAGHAPTVTHPTVHSSVASGHAHTTLSGHVARPVFDASRASAQPHVASHAAGTHSAVPIPKRIDLSAHSSVAHSTPPVSTTSPAASTGHTGATAAGAATTKGGMSALAVACTIGFAAVLGVGAAVYATDQPNSTPTAAPSYASAPNLSDYTSSTNDTSPSVDPVCATVSSDLPPKIQQFSKDASSATEAMDSYNTAMGSYNSGETSTAPDDSTVFSNVSTVISDLSSIEST